MNSANHIKELEEIIIKTIAERDQAFEEIRELKQENDELKKKLLFYENPHTPPSVTTLKTTDTESNIDSTPKKRGAPKGHRGATRPTPVPDVTKDVIAGHCEKCGSPNLKVLDSVEKTVIEDVLPPQEIKTIQYNKWKVECLQCGHIFTSKDSNCPQKGNFGINILVYITMLKYHLRGVLRKMQDFLLYKDNFEISVKGINDVLLRVGNACKSEYDLKVEKVRNAKWRYIDETGFKINGQKWWLWIFRTNDDETLVVIRKSRGRKVLDEILGTDHPGPHIVDGWSAYCKTSILQRCWSHLLREVKAYKTTSEAGKQLSKEIHDCFKDLRKFLDEDPPMEKRVSQKAIFEKKLEDIVDKFDGFNELAKPLTYIKNGLGHWYTCMLYPGMEPTNNLGEQAIREHVILRKIIGCFRSENGAENYQYIASLLADWRLQGKNGFEELEQLLRRELCMS
ncbi:MAG: IS66 family transposase [Deltaproteobacteria bacterium]|nr:IS66 family transposase [Deltaproteobacteria bacterium]